MIPRELYRRLPRAVPGALAVVAVVVAAGCEEIQAPVPRPLPPNIDIISSPALGDTVDPEEARTLALEFSRPMDHYSLLLLRRISFLLPVSVDRLEGHWNDERTRVEFHLEEFPVQPGATYEVVFAALRTADGELYNHSPYQVRYWVRGVPDLLPMQPHPRIESREFCRRVGKTSGSCSSELVMRSVAVGIDSMALETRCAGCTTPERRDLFRKVGPEVQWLGFDTYGRAGASLGSLRWRQPPGVFALPPRPGATITMPPQTAPNGTVLSHWTAKVIGTATPSQLVLASVVPIQVEFTDSWLVEIDYRVEAPGAAAERRLERWWLYPGVGIVRREARSERDGDTTSRLEIDSYAPTLSILSD